MGRSRARLACLARQFTDKEGAAPCLSRNRRSLCCRGSPEQFLRQQLRGRRRQFADRQDASVDPGVLLRGAQRLLQQRIDRCAFAAVTRHQHERGRHRLAEQVIHEDGRVEVGPLQVVHVDHQRPAIPYPSEQFTERGKGPFAQLLGIGDFLLGDLRHRADALEHRKEPGQREYFARHEIAGVFALELMQVAAEVVHDRIERLERHVLALVATALEHDSAALRAHLIEESMHQGAFAHARFADHEQRHGLSRNHRVVGCLEFGHLRLAAKELLTRRRGAGGSGRPGAGTARRPECGL